MRYTVDVEDHIEGRLTGREGTRYTSPSLTAQEASELVALLLGRAVDRRLEPATWTTAVAGGRRVVTLRALEGRQLTLGD